MSMCKHIAEKLLQFRDGTLPEEETQFLREHLQYCPPCLDLFESYEEVVEVLHRLQPLNMPSDLLQRMRQRLRQQGC
jgi:hypothetical protein